LWTELKRLGLPVICIDARHAKAVLKMQINKSDRNDAAGIARIMQTGWFKEMRVKDLDSHAVKAPDAMPPERSIGPAEFKVR
jgi:transposase